MKHFTCDLCGRNIAHERFVARIEVAACFNPDESAQAEDEGDHLEQISDEIASLDDTSQFAVPDNGPKTFEFDLCTGCLRRFVRDPLNRASRTQLNFSAN
jgi:hypothetical protein